MEKITILEYDIQNLNREYENIQNPGCLVWCVCFCFVITLLIPIFMVFNTRRRKNKCKRDIKEKTNEIENINKKE